MFSGRKVVGEVLMRVREVATGKIVHEEGLGSNLMVNQGRSNLAHFLAGDVTDRHITQWRWGEGGHDTTMPTMPLEVSLTDTTITPTAGLGISPGRKTSSAGTFNITSTTNRLSLAVDGGTAQTITLNTGAARTALQVASEVNGSFTDTIADGSSGSVVFTSPTFGTTSSLVFGSTSNSAYTALGLAVETLSGANHHTPATSYPSGSGGNQILFETTLEGYEANGSGTQGVSEMGLYDATGRLMARKTFGLQTKSAVFALDFDWRFDFSDQT